MAKRPTKPTVTEPTIPPQAAGPAATDAGPAGSAATGTGAPVTGEGQAQAGAGDTAPAAQPAESKAPALTETAAAQNSQAVTVIVIGPREGRRRIGRKFTAEPVSIDAADLTEAQLAALKADPLLRVKEIEAPY